ncbi:MAG TPA: hypothetical protein VJ833_00010 [Rhodanobacteraceae bacterium]|nr:hypothetical protein [Rhodanobacteraceae bacterium]
MGDILARLKQRNPALRTDAMQRLETASGAADLRRDPLLYADWLALLGAQDRAVAALKRLPIQRNSSEPDVIWEPAFDPIRSDPRLKAVLEKMGLPYAPLGPTSP